MEDKGVMVKPILKLNKKSRRKIKKHKYGKETLDVQYLKDKLLEEFSTRYGRILK